MTCKGAGSRSLNRFEITEKVQQLAHRPVNMNLCVRGKVILPEFGRDFFLCWVSSRTARPRGVALSYTLCAEWTVLLTHQL